MADERILVAFFLVGMGIRLENDVVDQLLDALVVEKAPHRFRGVDKSRFDVFFIEDVLQSEVFFVEESVEVLRVVQATG